MASSLPSRSLPRQLLQHMSIRVQPKPVAVSAVIAAAAAAVTSYQEPAGGRHGDGIAADGDAAASVPSVVNVAAAGRQLLEAERGASGRRAGPALAASMAKKLPEQGKGGNGGDIHKKPEQGKGGDGGDIHKTPKEGKGGNGGDIHVVSSLAAAGAVALLHARRWLAK